MLKFCDSPFSTIHIENHGEVHLCLCTPWHTKGSIGNLYESSLEDLWNSTWMQDFRNTVYDQSFKYCNTHYCWKIHNLDKIESFENIDIPRLPTIIYLQDLDDNCNLKCASCRNEQRYTDRINPDVDKILTQLTKLYKDFDRPVYISADGSGEFFSSRSYLNFLSNENLPKHFYFYINTNGTLINKNIDLITKRKDKIKCLTFSLDAASSETYRQLRGHSFTTVVSGIRKVKKLGINVVAQFVVQQKNYHEIMIYKNLCDDLGVDFIGLQGLNRWPHMTDQWWAENSLENNLHIDYNLFENLINKFKKADNVSVGGNIETVLQNYQNTKNNLIFPS